MRTNGLTTYKAGNLPGPIVIGGIGGSGTRVVAEIVRDLGIYFGRDLNESLDNLSFTLLFKRRKWYTSHRNNKPELESGFNCLARSITGFGKYSSREIRFLTKAVLSMSLHGHNAEKAGTGLWPVVRAIRMLKHENLKCQQLRGWGWKEPNSYLLLDQMNLFFPDLKYIHCIRNGLDMAYSLNQQQLFNWGPLFDVALPKQTVEIPASSLDFWIKANQWTIKVGEIMGSDRFLLINYNQLCMEPGIFIKRIAEFLGIIPDEPLFGKLVSIPGQPHTMGRYKDHDLTWLTPDKRKMIEDLGFTI